MLMARLHHGGRIVKRGPEDAAGRVHARKMRRALTESERVLWFCLRDRRLCGFKFRRQQPIGPFIVDFVCFEARLVVEADGGQHCVQRVYDASRTRYLQALGYRVVRVWNNEILQQREAVLEMILRALRSPHPNPLPQGERE